MDDGNVNPAPESRVPTLDDLLLRLKQTYRDKDQEDRRVLQNLLQRKKL